MRHAFLIIAHNNWWQLKNLIRLLDYPHHDIYLHIDQKSTDFKVDDFIGIAVCSQVYIFQKYKVFWGGYSQVETELFLLEQASKAGYDYYHVVSGVDLPLRSNEEFNAFFEKNAGKEFIDYDDDKLQNDPEIRRRTRLYHLLQNYRRRYKSDAINGFFTFLERISLVGQVVLGVNRVKHLDWNIKYGSNWVSITHNLTLRILAEKEKIKSVFSNTNCADELFIQTVAFNTGFQSCIYRPIGRQKGNMRYVDWKRGKNGNPYTFTVTDYAELKSADALFARKFSQSVDKEIIEKLSFELTHTNR